MRTRARHSLSFVSGQRLLFPCDPRRELSASPVRWLKSRSELSRPENRSANNSAARFDLRSVVFIPFAPGRARRRKRACAFRRSGAGSPRDPPGPAEAPRRRGLRATCGLPLRTQAARTTVQRSAGRAILPGPGPAVRALATRALERLRAAPRSSPRLPASFPGDLEAQGVHQQPRDKRAPGLESTGFFNLAEHRGRESQRYPRFHTFAEALRRFL